MSSSAQETEKKGEEAGLLAAAESGYGTTASPTKPWQWEADYGSIWMILIVVLSASFKQWLVLIFVMDDAIIANRDLMSCDSRRPDMNIPLAAACEWTKAFVRCFALLGLLVSLFVATRMLLHHRVYYQLLKHNALLRIRRFTALQDALFWILVFFFSQAALHFVLYMLQANSAMSASSTAVKNLQANATVEVDQAAEVSTFFFLPSVFLLIFVYGAYDTELYLLPLSKFFYEEPTKIQGLVKDMVFIEEEDAAIVAKSNLHKKENRPEDHPSPEWSEDEVYSQFIAKASVRQHKDDDGYRPHSSIGFLLWSLWPSRLLLDPRLQGKDGRASKLMTCIWSLPCLGLLAAGIYFTVYLAVKKVLDISEGQYEDSLGLLVLLCTTVFFFWFFFALIYDVLLPYDVFPALRKNTGGWVRF